MDAFCRKGQNAWRAIPSDFSIYQDGKAYLKEIKKAQARANHYADMGCKMMSEEIHKSIKSFKLIFEKKFYGFCKIKLTDVAAILAKKYNFSFSDQKLYLNFENSVKFVGKELLTALQPSLRYFWGDQPSKPFSYKCTSYVANKLNINLGELDLIEYKPIFDQYLLIVPSIDTSEFKADVFFKMFNFSEDDIQSQFDSLLIKEGKVSPILIGERDNNCYLIKEITHS